MLTLHDGGGGRPAGLKCRHQRLTLQPGDRGAQFIADDVCLVSGWSLRVVERVVTTHQEGGGR